MHIQSLHMHYIILNFENTMACAGAMPFYQEFSFTTRMRDVAAQKLEKGAASRRQALPASGWRSLLNNKLYYLASSNMSSMAKGPIKLP